MTDLALGPIDYLALEFPTTELKGEGLAALVDLVDRGIIRILDFRFATRNPDGSYTALAIADLDGDGTLDLAVFAGVESGLLDGDDLSHAVSLIEPGHGVGLLVYENLWAEPFVTAMRQVGAEVITSGRIPAGDVLAALDALESAEA